MIHLNLSKKLIELIEKNNQVSNMFNFKLKKKEKEKKSKFDRNYSIL